MNYYELQKQISILTKLKRIISIDFGTARVGIASCDALHISVSPKKTLLYQSDNFWQELLNTIANEDAAAIVVGKPENFVSYNNNSDLNSRDLNNNNLIEKHKIVVDKPENFVNYNNNSDLNNNNLIETHKIVVGKPENFVSYNNNSDLNNSDLNNNNLIETHKTTHQILLAALDIFISELKSRVSLPIFIQDESFSSKKAVETMLEIRKKKKKRATKGNTDKIAAAIILQNFIKYYNL